MKAQRNQVNKSRLVECKMESDLYRNASSIETKLIGIEALSQRIGIRPHTIYQWIHQRRVPFPYIKAGRTVKFDPMDVNAWINAQKVSPQK